MLRLSIGRAFAVAIALACSFASSTLRAANGVFYPIENRYEPYATFYMTNAQSASRQMILNGDFSTDALMACYYATLSSAEFNNLWADGLLKYVQFGSTYDQYLETVATAGGHAYLASQYAYKAYLANPNGYSQAATGWSYYGASAAYMAYLTPAPGQFIYGLGPRTCST